MSAPWLIPPQFERPYDEEPDDRPLFSEMALVYLAVMVSVVLLLGAG